MARRRFFWKAGRKPGNTGWPVTQRDLSADVTPDYVPMDVLMQDQRRADVWIAEVKR